MRRYIVIILIVCSLIDIGASQEEIRINEFCIKGGEWIELYNPSSASVELDGYSIETSEGIIEFTTEEIPAYGYHILEPSGFLDNNGDTIVLKDNDSVIDSVSYGYRGYAPAPPSYESCVFVNGEWNLDLTPTKGMENDAPPVNLGNSIRINEYYEKSIEVYNPRTVSIDLDDFFLSDGDGIFYLTGTIDSRNVRVFESTITLQEEDVLYLFNASGELIDMVGYYGHDLQESIQRIPDGNVVYGYSWDTSDLHDTYESLGTINDFFVISEISENFIELYTPIPREVSFSLSLETIRTFTTYVDQFLVISNDESSFFSKFGFHPDIVINERFSEVLLEYNGMMDHAVWNHGTLARFPILSNTSFAETKPTPGEYNRLYSLDPPIILTEVMYNPRKSDYYYEWVEVYNSSDTLYDPTNLQCGGDEILGDPIPPGECAVITDEYTHVFDEVEVENELRVNGNLSLSNSGDHVVIMQGEVILDEVKYSGNAKEGHSLEKINGVWRYGPLGGTPGYIPEPEEPEDPQELQKRVYVSSIFSTNKKLEEEIAKKIEELENTVLCDSEEFLSIKKTFENINSVFIVKNRKLKKIKERLNALKPYKEDVEKYKAKVLFLQNKDQYYTLNEVLKDRLKENNIGTYTTNEFPALDEYDIVIVTNPGEDFNEKEVMKLEEYMRDGGVLILCGTYHTYLNIDLNRISKKYGTTFIKSSFRDDKSNSGRSYYVRVKEFPSFPFYEDVSELNISGGVLNYRETTVLLRGNESSYAATSDGRIEDFAIITLREVGDGYLVCSGSSQMFTTGIKYGDNLEFTIALIEYLLTLI